MQDASIAPEISRLYEDLADRILARDEEGARRIYHELLHVGRPLEILADATRVPALRRTLEPELFWERAGKERDSKIRDAPQQHDSALPEVARQSIIDGYATALLVGRFLDRRRLRIAILTISGASAVALLLR
jgi:hypothetical protein